jgi:hypothetical protein
VGEFISHIKIHQISLISISIFRQKRKHKKDKKDKESKKHKADVIVDQDCIDNGGWWKTENTSQISGKID